MIQVFLRNVPRSLHVLLFASLCALLGKVFIANRLPQAFSGAYELGVIVEGLLASIIASYVFYLIVVHTKELQDKRLILPHVTRWAKLVVGDCKSQLRDINKAASCELDIGNLTKGAVHAAMRLIRPNDNAPHLLGFDGTHHATWLQYFEFHRVHSKNFITKIMRHLTFMDTELVALVAAIDDCEHFEFVHHTINAPFANQDATVFADPFFEYCTACKALENYLGRESLTKPSG